MRKKGKRREYITDKTHKKEKTTTKLLIKRGRRLREKLRLDSGYFVGIGIWAWGI